MVAEMSSSAWVLMEDDCSLGDCWGPPPLFHVPPPPIPAEFCEEFDMSCPSQLNVADAEFKKIGSFPSVTVIVCCTLLSAVILLVIAVVVWRKRRKGVTQTKDFDHHHGPPMMNGNGILYEDLSHARPRPPIAPPTMEMLDVNHQHSMENNGMIGNPKLDFSYFLNPPPIYEELPEIDTGHLDRNNGPSEDEFAEDELSVIDVPINQCHPGMSLGYDGVGGGNDPNNPLSRYHNSVNRGTKPRAQSLNRKRNSARNTVSAAGGGNAGGGFKSQRSLDRRTRNAIANKYTGTTPRPLIPSNPAYRATMGGSGMLILSDQNGMTMKIPPHLVAVLTESALQNSGVRPYDVIQPPGGMAPNSINPSQLNAIYPSSRSSGSSYGDGSNSSGSARINPNGNSAESSSFDSGLGQHSVASFVNSPAYEPSGYPINSFDYSTVQGEIPQSHYQSIQQHHHQQQQHPSFRRLRMTTADRDHPLNHDYSNHFLT